MCRTSGMPFSGEATYFLTGESRGYDLDAATFLKPKPTHDYGAVEVALSYNFIKNRDIPAGDTTGVCKPALGAVPSGTHVTKCNVTSVTAGLNYYVNNNVQFMLDYYYGAFNAGNAATPATPAGTIRRRSTRASRSTSEGTAATLSPPGRVSARRGRPSTQYPATGPCPAAGSFFPASRRGSGLRNQARPALSSAHQPGWRGIRGFVVEGGIALADTIGYATDLITNHVRRSLAALRVPADSC